MKFATKILFTLILLSAVPAFAKETTSTKICGKVVDTKTKTDDAETADETPKVEAKPAAGVAGGIVGVVSTPAPITEE